MALFKNIVVFQFSPGVSMDIDLALDYDLMLEHQLRPVGSMEMSSVGFVPVASGGEFLMNIDGGDLRLFAIGIEQHELSAKAIAYKLDKKIKSIQMSEGRTVSSKERKRLKDDILNEMLPKAPVKLSTIYAYLDLAENRLIIDSSTTSKAELVATVLRKALGSFPAVPMTVSAEAMAPHAVMTKWLRGDDLPASLSLGSDVELQDKSVSRGAKWRGRNADLESEDVLEHLRNGMTVTKLGLHFDDKCSFELGEDLVMRKFKLTDVYLEDNMPETDEDDRDHSLRASVFILAAAVRDCINYLAAEERLDIVAPEGN